MDCNVEFYTTVSACSSIDKKHRSKHNSFVAWRLAKMLSSAAALLYSANIEVTSCCSSVQVDQKTADHKKHFLVIKVSRPALQNCIAKLNHSFGCVLSDGKSIGMALSVSTLTPGLKVWVGGFAVHLMKLSTEQQKVLHVLKSCSNFESLSVIIPRQNVPIPPTSTATAANESDSALFQLTAADLIKELTPLHNFTERATVWKHFRDHSFFPSVKWLRWYLGDAVGFYFAWLFYYCLALCIPSSFGLLTGLFEYIFVSSETSRLNPATIPSISMFRIVYGLVVIIWAISCTKIWRRQQNQLAEDWLTPALSSSADMPNWLSSPTEKLLPSFRGETRRSPITGEWELHFPASKQRILYILSGSITFLCVLMALLANVLLLNLEGVIDPHRSPHLYFRFVACFCDPGRIFDPQVGGLNFIPGVLHSLVVFFLNQVVFRRVAELLTNMENQKTRADWDYSLVVKRFIFEAIDAYASPLYIGLILVDWPNLQSYLLTTFGTDSLRRLIAECLIPWASSRWRGRRDTYKKSDDPLPNYCQENIMALNAALYSVNYEPFDDFLEMVLEHGYIVIFAFACPPYLAIMGLACAFAEAYFDAFKLLQIVRRPMPCLLRRRQDIWLMLLSVQAWLAVFSNICLLARRTDWEMGTLFLLEHILIILGLGIEFGISNTPVDAKNAFRRRVYQRYKRKLSMNKI